MKRIVCIALLMFGTTMAGATNGIAENKQNKDKNMNKLELTQEWDKVFPKSDKVNHNKVTFRNRYGHAQRRE